jgi:hypothetical protein
MTVSTATPSRERNISRLCTWCRALALVMGRLPLGGSEADGLTMLPCCASMLFDICMPLPTSDACNKQGQDLRWLLYCMQSCPPSSKAPLAEGTRRVTSKFACLRLRLQRARVAAEAAVLHRLRSRHV